MLYVALETSGAPLLRPPRWPIAATGGQLAGRLAQLPRLSQPVMCPALLQQWSTFLDLVFSNPLTSPLQALSIL